MSVAQRLAVLVVATLICSTAFAATDPLLTALEESKASGKGLSFHVSGQTIAGVVVSIDERFVVARSLAQGTIVIRLDRIDAVAGFVVLPAERK